MAISFAGINLCLPDPERGLISWLDRALPLDDMRLFAEEAATDGLSAWNNIRTQAPRFSLPRYNWPKPPALKLNTVWWPITGATRWARGLFLVNSDQMQQILDACPSGQSETLFLSDDTRDVSLTMYPLTARQLSTGLYLLPLVDIRYFWQFSDVGFVSDISQNDGLGETTQWQDLLASLEDNLPGVDTIDWTLDESWPDPDPELLRDYENAATMLDAMGASVGCRLVAKLDGTFALQTAVAAEEELQTWPEQPLLAGGDGYMAQNVQPIGIQVVFPRCYNLDRIDEFGTYLSENDNNSDEYRQQPPRTSLVVVDTYPAIYHGTVDDTGFDIDDSISNTSDLEERASAVLTVIDDWTRYEYDVTFVGILTSAEWSGCAYDDYVYFHCGEQYERPVGAALDQPLCGPGDYACYTRIASLPPNVVFPMLFHTPGQDLWSGWCKLTEDLAEGTVEGTLIAAAHVMKWTSADTGTLTEETEWSLTVRDSTGNMAFKSGDLVYCKHRMSDDGPVCEIVAAGGGSSLKLGVLDKALSQGSTATVSVWEDGADTDEDIEASDWLMKAGSDDISSGKKVVCAQINGTWYVIEAECE